MTKLGAAGSLMGERLEDIEDDGVDVAASPSDGHKRGVGRPSKEPVDSSDGSPSPDQKTGTKPISLTDQRSLSSQLITKANWNLVRSKKGGLKNVLGEAEQRGNGAEVGVTTTENYNDETQAVHKTRIEDRDRAVAEAYKKSMLPLWLECLPYFVLVSQE